MTATSKICKPNPSHVLEAAQDYGRRNCKGGWEARSLAGVHGAGDMDLSRREDARNLEAALAGLDMSAEI